MKKQTNTQLASQVLGKHWSRSRFWKALGLSIKGAQVLLNLSRSLEREEILELRSGKFWADHALPGTAFIGDGMVITYNDTDRTAEMIQRKRGETISVVIPFELAEELYDLNLSFWSKKAALERAGGLEVAPAYDEELKRVENAMAPLLDRLADYG